MTKGVSKGEQKKLDILTKNFEKLEESGKGYIRKLTQKLVNIHCDGELLNKHKVYFLRRDGNRILKLT
jgi:hypothetical protein